MDAPLYGVLGTDNLIRIVDNRQPAPADRRCVKRGTLCNNSKKADIIDYLWYLDADPPETDAALFVEADVVQAAVASAFSQEEAAIFTIEELAYAYAWLQLSRQDLCAAVAEALQVHNLLLDMNNP